jgi:hypothetical protein
VVLTRLCLRRNQHLLDTHVEARDLQDLLQYPNGLFHVGQCADATGARSQIEGE